MKSYAEFFASRRCPARARKGEVPTNLGKCLLAHTGIDHWQISIASYHGSTKLRSNRVPFQQRNRTEN